MEILKKSEVNENTHCDPLGIYGALKFSAEKIIIAYNQVFKLPYTIIRPSALYGERCISRRVGQIFIENALFDKDIVIDGDGNEKLDFTYIEDLTDGILKIISNVKSRNEIFNLTFGEGRKIKDLIKILKKFFPNLRVKYKKRDKLMPKRGKLNMIKAKKLLKFNPKWRLEEGYTNYIKWYLEFYKENLNKFK